MPLPGLFILYWYSTRSIVRPLAGNVYLHLSNYIFAYPTSNPLPVGSFQTEYRTVPPLFPAR